VIPSYQFRPQCSTKVIKLLIPYSFGNQMADLLYRAPLLLMPLLVLETLNAEFSAYAYIGWMFGFLLAIPGITLSTSAFAEGSHAPEKMRPILFRAAQFGLTLTILLAVIIGFGAPLILSVFGESYATETTSLLRWLAVTAPFVVVNCLYFSMLRIQKRIGRLILLAALSAIFTFTISLFTLQEIGLASTGIAWLIAQVLVTFIAYGSDTV
jgi:O-antigen/teichoic acid export membrane protein